MNQPPIPSAAHKMHSRAAATGHKTPNTSRPIKKKPMFEARRLSASSNETKGAPVLYPMHAGTHTHDERNKNGSRRPESTNLVRYGGSK